MVELRPVRDFIAIRFFFLAAFEAASSGVGITAGGGIGGALGVLKSDPIGHLHRLWLLKHSTTRGCVLARGLFIKPMPDKARMTEFTGAG